MTLSGSGTVEYLAPAIAVILLVALALRFPSPSGFQRRTLSIVVALVSATLATRMSGLLHFEIPHVAQASGAFAVFLLVTLVYRLISTGRK